MVDVLHGLTLAPADGTLGAAPGQILADGTHYRLDGPVDGHATLLISGLGDFSYRWERLTHALTRAGRRVLQYDQYGKGWSTPPEGFRYDAAGHDAQLHRLLVTLGLSDAPLTIIAQYPQQQRSNPRLAAEQSTPLVPCSCVLL